LISAQGKYKLATWIAFASCWGISIPLAALYVYGFKIDLQGLASAVTIGNLTAGALLSYMLLTTDWFRMASKIQEQSCSTASASEGGTGDTNEEIYACLRPNSYAAKARARQNIRLLTIPSGYRSGLLLGNIYSRTGTYLLMVHKWSLLYGRVRVGDSILAINGVDVTQEGAECISKILQTSRMCDRHLAFASPHRDLDVDDDEDLTVQFIAEEEE
jgi:hypothetical protein